MNMTIQGFMEDCNRIDWYNVAVVDGLQVATMYVVKISEDTNPKKVIGLFNKFFSENADRYGDWSVIEFHGYLIVGRDNETQ